MVYRRPREEAIPLLEPLAKSDFVLMSNKAGYPALWGLRSDEDREVSLKGLTTGLEKVLQE